LNFQLNKAVVDSILCLCCALPFPLFRPIVYFQWGRKPLPGDRWCGLS